MKKGSELTALSKRYFAGEITRADFDREKARILGTPAPPNTPSALPAQQQSAPAQPASITTWLTEVGLPELIPLFEEQGIDVGILGELTESDLTAMGVVKLGDRKRLMKAIRGIAQQTSGSMGHTAPQVSVRQQPPAPRRSAMPGASRGPDPNTSLETLEAKAERLRKTLLHGSERGRIGPLSGSLGVSASDSPRFRHPELGHSIEDVHTDHRFPPLPFFGP